MANNQVGYECLANKKEITFHREYWETPASAGVCIMMV